MEEGVASVRHKTRGKDFVVDGFYLSCNSSFGA